MKKINPPTSELPDAYKLEVKDDENLDVVESETKDVPTSKVLNYDLKSFKSFRILRRQYKQKNQLSVFIADMSRVLKEFSPRDNQLDCELLVHVLNIAEQYFIYGNDAEREQMKHYAIQKIMKPYFRNNEIVLDKMIASSYHLVKKSTLAKRLAKKLSKKVFFF